MNGFAGKAPWYVAGLAFECLGCGHCCAGPNEGYVWVTDDDIAAIAGHLGLDEAGFRHRHVRKVSRRYSLKERKGSKDCEFLIPKGDGGRQACAIYPVRPAQCRTWPFWPGNLLSPEAWDRAGLRCGGINRGRLFTVTEIEERRHATRQ